MSPDTVIAFTMPISFFLLLGGFLFYRYKSQQKKLESLIKIVELGGNVDPDMMKMLSSDGSRSYKTDYRSGLIWLAIGVPLSLALYTEDGVTGSLIGSIFIFIGIAKLVSGKYRWREDD